MDDMRRFAYFGVVASYDAGYGIGPDQCRVIADTVAGKDPNAARHIGEGTGITTPSAARGPNMRQSTYRVRTAEQGRRTVQDVAHDFASLRSVMKVPILKYWVDDTVPEVYTAVIEEARKQNMLVVTGGGKDDIGFMRAGRSRLGSRPS